VRGAAEGKGLGNAFLSHIQAVDAIYHVTRAFIAKEIEHVEGTVDPIRDFQIIRSELIAKDKQWMTDHTDGLKKKARAQATKEQKEEIQCCERVLELLNAGGEVRHGNWSTKDISFLGPYPLLTAKPVVYLVNISRQNMETSTNKWFKDIKEWVTANSPDDPVIPFSVAFEEHLNTLSPEERKAYCEEKKVQSMMPRIIKSGYKALQCINFFTVGQDEVRAWSVRDGTRAPQAAGTIHGDFETHFICAETYSYEDFVASGNSETAARAAGKVRTQGKEYEVVDGDIMHFRHNAGGAGKKK
jgi:obg-like ATPase 1